MPLALSAALLFGSAVLAGGWATARSGRRRRIGAVAQYRGVTEPRSTAPTSACPRAEQAALSSEIFTNNIRVTLLAFAARDRRSASARALVLLVNGVLLGVVARAVDRSGQRDASSSSW